MNNKEILLKHIPIADFIAAMNGPGCEVVIHDLSDLEHSILYITKPNLTHRAVGGPITDYALALLHNREYDRNPHVVNYLGRTDNKQRVFRSSTYFIRNTDEVIGLLCVNIDITDLAMAGAVIHRLLLVDVHDLLGKAHNESFTMDLDYIINRVIETNAGDVSPKELSLDARRQIVRELYEKGAFMLKGAIHKVADIFGVSNQTVYRYIDDVARNAADNEPRQA